MGDRLAVRRQPLGGAGLDKAPERESGQRQRQARMRGQDMADHRQHILGFAIAIVVLPRAFAYPAIIRPQRQETMRLQHPGQQLGNLVLGGASLAGVRVGHHGNATRGGVGGIDQDFKLSGGPCNELAGGCGWGERRRHQGGGRLEWPNWLNRREGMPGNACRHMCMRSIPPARPGRQRPAMSGSSLKAHRPTVRLSAKGGPPE